MSFTLAEDPATPDRTNTIDQLKEVLPHPSTAVQGMKAKTGGEVAGPCPKCGGDDRFFIRSDGSFGCRQCNPRGGDKIDFYQWLHDTDVSGLAERHLSNPAPAKPKLGPAAAIPENLTAEYVYQDATGAEVYRIRRYEAPGRKKNFLQGRMIGGCWEPGVKGKVDLVLYHLPEVLAARQVILCEGEKNVNDVRALGLIATTNPGGAGKWQDSYSQALAGKEIVILPDNDEPGRKHAEMVSQELLKADCKVHIVNLPGLVEKGDVSDWITRGGSRAELIQIIEATAEAVQEVEPGDQETHGWPKPLDLMKLSSSEPQPPKFIMADWLPCGYATLLAGHGGVGKSGIALTEAVCLAAGIPFFGIQVERRRVLYLSCEDRERVLHWRLARICRYLGISMSNLSGWLEVLDLVGHDTILFQSGRDCPAYGHLKARMIQAGTQVLFVDGISDTYDGNENARAEVKAFVNLLLALIPPDEGAVVLVGHVAKLAANTRTTEGYSGSTGWHNAVRARWYLYPESTVSEDGTAARTGGLVLELQKSNLGPTDHAMTFSWDDAAGMFIGKEKGGESHFDRKYHDREEMEGIIAAFRSCPDYIPAATMGQRTAFHVLSVQPDFPESLRSGSGSRKRFWRHIEALRAMRTLTEASITRKSDRAKVRVLALDKDLQECSNAEKNIPAPMLAAPSASNAAMLAGGYRGSYACTPSGEESIDTLDDIRLEVGNEG